MRKIDSDDKKIGSSVRALCLLLAAMMAGSGCGPGEAGRAPKAAAELAAHTAEFKQGVVKVTDGVYVAIGYGLANSILLEGKGGAIIVDTMESMESAREVRAAFEKITDKPVRALIYTHNHTDHIFGARVWADTKPEVYAHETMSYYVDRIAGKLRPVTGTRAMRMFGTFLDEKGLVNAGIGPRLRFNEKTSVGMIRPTKTFRDKLDVTIAGIKIKLVFAPGETNDQLFVWLPEKKVLLPGDNFYRSFPNLYTIRGTPFRSMERWVNSLDKMRDLKPEYLVPSHTRPISGGEKVMKALTDYRDAIQYVHDQTIRGINRGLTPDELVEEVQLPPHLKESPYLREYYGKVSWSVRALFSGQLGWFGGNSSQLHRLGPRKRAEMMSEIAGGRAKLTEFARKAGREGRHQAALELTDHLLQLEPGDAAVREIRVRALRALGAAENNANARHYYLTEALELERGKVVRESASIDAKTIHAFPMELFFTSLRVNLDPQASADLNTKVGFIFSDTGEKYSVHVRRGVAEVRKRLPANPDILVRADSRKWKEMLARKRNPVATVASFKYDKGGRLAFLGFLRLFKPAAMKLPAKPR